MRWELGSAVLAFCLGVVSTQACAADIGCDGFIDKLRAGASELGVDFGHSLVVSRARSDTDVFDITTKSDIEGDMSCRKGRLIRFEARILEPASAHAAAEFEGFQAAAMRAAFGWDAAKGRSTARAMTADAKEYLAASRQRADVYISGKTEEHEPGGISLGLIVTDTDSAFIIIGAEN
jgi:hypothetical protein